MISTRHAHAAPTKRTNFHRRIAAPLAAVLLILPMSAFADPAPATPSAAVYRWVDAKGAVHYDDQNLRGQQVTRDNIGHRSIRQAPDWTGVVPADFAHAVETHCSLMRERLHNYQDASALYLRDSGGKVRALSAAQAQNMIADTQREQGRYCAPDAARVMYNQRTANDQTASRR